VGLRDRPGQRLTLTLSGGAGQLGQLVVEARWVLGERDVPDPVVPGCPSRGAGLEDVFGHGGQDDLVLAAMGDQDRDGCLGQHRVGVDLAAAATSLHALGARYQWARTLVMLGGDDRERGEQELAALGASPMPWPR